MKNMTDFQKNKVYEALNAFDVQIYINGTMSGGIDPVPRIQETVACFGANDGEDHVDLYWQYPARGGLAGEYTVADRSIHRTRYIVGDEGEICRIDENGDRIKPFDVDEDDSFYDLVEDHIQNFYSEWSENLDSDHDFESRFWYLEVNSVDVLDSADYDNKCKRFELESKYKETVNKVQDFDDGISGTLEDFESCLS